MSRTAALAALAALSALLSACSGAAEREGSPQSGEMQSTAAVTPMNLPAPATIVGSWRVVAVDGAQLRAGDAISLMGDGQEIWWEPRCAGFIFGYTLDGSTFSTGPRVTTPPASTSTPAPVCAIGQPAGLQEVSRALQRAERIGQTPDKGIRITGGGHSLTLVAQ